jgi:hypothetical protein
LKKDFQKKIIFKFQEKKFIKKNQICLKKFKRQGAIEKQPKFNATKNQIRRFLASYFSIRQISRLLGPVLKKAGKDSSHYRLS